MVRSFRADLPQAGRYAHAAARFVMCNSRLARRIRRDVAVMEDAIALIDAMLNAGNRPFQIKQISFSEGFRLHQAPVAEIRPLFQHYFRRSTKRYMALAHRSVVETSA